MYMYRYDRVERCGLEKDFITDENNRKIQQSGATETAAMVISVEDRVRWKRLQLFQFIIMLHMYRLTLIISLTTTCSVRVRGQFSRVASDYN